MVNDGKRLQGPERQKRPRALFFYLRNEADQQRPAATQVPPLAQLKVPLRIDGVMVSVTASTEAVPVAVMTPVAAVVTVATLAVAAARAAGTSLDPLAQSVNAPVTLAQSATAF